MSKLSQGCYTEMCNIKAIEVIKIKLANDYKKLLIFPTQYRCYPGRVNTTSILLKGLVG